MPEAATISRRVLKSRQRKRYKAGKAQSPESVAGLGDPDLVAQSIIAKLRYAASHRFPWEEEWRFAIRAWFQTPTDEREDSWESDRYMPLILKQVETALPALVAATMDTNGTFRMHGRTRQGKENARAMQRLVNWQVENKSGAVEAYEDMLWWSTLIGTGYVDHYWVEYDEERVIAVIGEDGQKKIQKKKIRVADHPVVECLNPLDVYAIPDGKVGDDNDWYILRVVTSPGALKRVAGEGHIDGEALKKWFETKPWETTDQSGLSWFDEVANTSFEEWLSEIGLRSRLDDDTDQDDPYDDDKPIVVLKYVSKKETITLGDRQHVIGYSQNETVHGKTGIIDHQFLKVPDSPYGRGLGGILMGHQSLLNENINAWMDTVNIERMAPIVIDKSRANLLDDELEVEPNAIFRTRGTDAIKRLELPAPTNLAMTMDQHLAHDADDLTGFTEQARGLAPGANQTATAFQGLQSNIQTRLILHVRRVGRTLKQSGELLVMLNQQFMTREEVVLATGEDGLEYTTITPQQTVGDMLVSVSISASRASPEMRAQKLLQFLQVVIPLIQGGMFEHPTVRRLLRMVLDANEVEDADLLLPRGAGIKKDPLMENGLLERMIQVPVTPEEDHAQHIQQHQELLNALIDQGADDAQVAVVTKHIEEHHKAAGAAAAQIAQGMQAQQAQGADGAGIGPGGGGPARQEANLAGAATGGQGMPGVAAPGPAAPGRQV